MSSKRLPWLLLALVAVATLVITGDPMNPDATVVAASVRHEPGLSIRAVLPRSSPTGNGHADPFATNLPDALPAVPQQKVENQTQVQIEPFAWSVIGKQFDAATGWTVFLTRGMETTLVRVGDVLDDGYRIVAINPPAMTLRHVKRNTRRTIDVGDPKNESHP